MISHNLHALHHPPLPQHPQVTDRLQRNLSSQLLKPFVVVSLG
jgi:hypothetical protein